MDALDASTAAPLPMLEFDVVRHRGHWRVFHIGKHSAPYESQDAAVAAAVTQAKQSVADGRQARVRLKRTDDEERLIALEPQNSM